MGITKKMQLEDAENELSDQCCIRCGDRLTKEQVEDKEWAADLCYNCYEPQDD